ncbi:hypothetical protein Tco_1384701 [Tanacetum coccineum]
MKKMGFGGKWCKWVDSCLRSASMSILVNRSPTEEFGLERGVRKGEPLSPFLFIMAAIGLNAIVSEAVEKGIFTGVVVGENNGYRLGVGGNGVWKDIVKIGEEIDEVEIEFSSSCIGVLGDGGDIRFWFDRWVDNHRLCDRFPMLFHLNRRKV